MEKNIINDVATIDKTEGTISLENKNGSNITSEKTICVLEDKVLSSSNYEDVNSVSDNISNDNINIILNQNNLKVNDVCDQDITTSTSNNQNHSNVNNLNHVHNNNKTCSLDPTNSSHDKKMFDIKEKLQLEKEVKQLKFCLEEKEKQLETAAKYGITILQNNESLQSYIDKKEEEIKIKIEEMKDDEHVLKMQIESERLAHESVILELKNDLIAFKSASEDEKKEWRGVEKEMSDKVKHLTLINDNLTDQILNASLQEEENMSQVSSLRLQVSETEQEQENHMQDLQNELIDLRVEMERMVRLKTDECRLLNTTLDQAQDRLASMEKERNSETNRAEQLQNDLMRLEDKYVVLLSKVESNDECNEDERTGANFNEMSLFAELDVLSDAVHAHELINGKNSISGKSSLGTQLRQEILEVYRQVQRLMMEVKGEGHLWSPEVVDINDLKAGQLLFSLTQLHQLLNRRFNTDSLPPLSDDQTRLEKQVEQLKEQSATLKDQLASNHKTLDRVKEELNVRDQQLRRSSDHKNALDNTLKKYRLDIDSLQHTIDQLKTVGSEKNVDSEQLTQDLRRERDQTVIKCRSYEDEVMTVRLDMKDLDRQLMESVEQKLQLSNQLEAWQNDMHELIENKMAGEIERDSLRSHLKPRLSLSSSTANAVRPNSFKKRFSLKWS